MLQNEIEKSVYYHEMLEMAGGVVFSKVRRVDSSFDIASEVRASRFNQWNIRSFIDGFTFLKLNL